MRKALLTGITGQDGSYLTELLLSKGYQVHGIIRRSSTFNTERIEHLYKDPSQAETSMFLHYGDLTDAGSLRAVMKKVMPDEIYNLGAQSHVRVSFDLPEYTIETAGLGAVRMLEAMKEICPKARFYQASSSEMFGTSPGPQSEKTPFAPASPYACAKLLAHDTVKNYREGYGLFACSGILFNHESPRRTETFVTRKITRAAGRIACGLQHRLFLGNLDAKRDWGYAGDYVEAMWMMLQQDQPDDFVIATGESYSVREFLESVFTLHGLDYKNHVGFDARYLRPREVDFLQGDASKAREKLGWKPKMSFNGLVKRMTVADWQLAQNEKQLSHFKPMGM